MIEIYLLEQLEAFQRTGSITLTAEELHVSQPSVSKAMKKLEDQFGVPLFIREKKKVRLNENGELAAKYAHIILEKESEMMVQVQLSHNNRIDYVFGAFSLGSALTVQYIHNTAIPKKKASWHVGTNEDLINGLADELYKFIITDHPISDEKLSCIPAGSEQLYYCFVPNQNTQSLDGVYFSDIKGKVILCPAENGAWQELIDSTLNETMFIYQDTNEAIDRLTEKTDLPALNSDLGLRNGALRPNRKSLPILDKEATKSLYCVYHRDNELELGPFLHSLAKLYTNK